MDEINDAVITQLKEQKGHEELLVLWEQIWGAYQEQGGAGVDQLIENLLRYPADEEEDE